jgi:hypothetical protein
MRMEKEGRDNNVMEMTSTTKLKEEDKDQQEIRKEIDYMKHYSFPENNIGCLLIFKKLKMCVYQRKRYLDPALTEQIFVSLNSAFLEANSSNYTYVMWRLQFSLYTI